MLPWLTFSCTARLDYTLHVACTAQDHPTDFLLLPGENQFRNWFIWVIIPAFLVCSIFWITRLSKGLRLFPAMVFVPTMQIAWTFFSIISGMLYFEEYTEFTPTSAVMFALGVAVSR